MSRRVLEELLRPDAQPRDWYGWLTNQAGHAALVGQPAALALLIAGVPAGIALPAIGIVYLVLWERLIQRGRDWDDSLTDTAAVVVGAVILWAVAERSAGFAGAILALWAVGLAAGVNERATTPEIPPEE